MLADAILFDMDDTLLRNNVTLESAWFRACEDAAAETKSIKPGELLRQIDIVREWYWSDPERHHSGRLNLLATRTSFVKTALERLGCDDGQIAETIANRYMQLLEESLELFPDVEDTLRQLVKKKVKMALLTNGAGDVQRQKIKRFGLDRYFAVCLIEGEVGWGKPDRHVFEAALKKLAVTPEQAWMVGDDLQRDIAGAQQVGIFSVWHDSEKTGLPRDSKVVPDRIINNISELLSL
jgi:putative hydrolase of the HAD superfamily